MKFIFILTLNKKSITLFSNTHWILKAFKTKFTNHMQHCNESINSPSSQSTNMRLQANQSICVCVKILSIKKLKKNKKRRSKWRSDFNSKHLHKNARKKVSLYWCYLSRIQVKIFLGWFLEYTYKHNEWRTY